MFGWWFEGGLRWFGWWFYGGLGGGFGGGLKVVLKLFEWWFEGGFKMV